MYKIIVASHGPMAEGMKASLEFVMGKAGCVEAICLDEDGVSRFADKIKDAADRAAGEEVLALVDFAYGTPFNEFSRAIGSFGGNIEILTGMNLPALVEAVNGQLQDKTLEQTLPAVREAAVMSSFSEILAGQELCDGDE